MKLQSWSHSRPTPRRQLKKLITKGQKADEENFRNFAEPVQKRILSALTFLPEERRLRVAKMLTAFSQGMQATRKAGFLALLLIYTGIEWAIIIGSYYTLFLAFPASASFELTDVVVFLGFVSFGSIEQWFDLGREGEARSERIGDEPRRLASISIRAAALNFYGTPYEAITAGEQAVALAERLADATWLAFAQYGLGQAYFVAGRYRDAESLLNRASARLASAPENVPPGTTTSSLLVLCYMMKAIVYASIGEYDDSEKCSWQASDLAERNSRPYPDSTAHRAASRWRKSKRSLRQSTRDGRPSWLRNRGKKSACTRAARARTYAASAPRGCTRGSCTRHYIRWRDSKSTSANTDS